MRREAFIGAAAAFGASCASSPLRAIADEPPVPSPPAPDRLPAALILGGGGARGAYQAGVIEGLRLAAGVSDGQPLPGVDFVCGTSIGSINAWYVATAQYTALRTLWHVAAHENIFAIKGRFRAVTSPGAFIVTKIVQALSLARGLTKNVQGILAGENVKLWLDKNIDPSRTVLMPYALTVTNLDRSRPEIFYRAPGPFSEAAKNAAFQRVRRAVGFSAAVRPAPDDLLATAMRASTAIPLLFDPVVMPSLEGTQDRFIDGGVTDDDPVDVGRAAAKSVYSILVDPIATPRQAYANALDIVVGAFGAAQARIFESTLRAAYLETQEKRAILSAAHGSTGSLDLDDVLDVDLYFLRPAVEPAVQFAEFDRQDKMDATYDLGRSDAARGWTPYVPPPPGPSL
jgi:predicted acylesterase/phospholipase RssA